MAWTKTAITWPLSAASIEQAVKPIAAAIKGAHSGALSNLSAAASAVTIKSGPLSAQAANLLDQRAMLNQLLATGQRVTVTPYDLGVGKVEETGHYLAPQNAANRLAEKLTDTEDDHRPRGEVHAVGLMVTAGTLTEFADQLNLVVAAINLPELSACARRVSAEIAHERQRMQTASKGVIPRWVPGKHHASPLRASAALLGSKIAQVESLASDIVTAIDKLAALAAKRDAWHETQNQALEALKSGMKGGLYRMSAVGSTSSVASQILTGLPSYEQPYSAATLIVSDEPLTFFEELLP